MIGKTEQKEMDIWQHMNYLYSASPKPIIMDGKGQRIVGDVLGPINQGNAVTLDCQVTGGILFKWLQGLFNATTVYSRIC